jgi:hypothetical protein
MKTKRTYSEQGECYSVSLEPLTWEMARESCISNNGSLVILRNTAQFYLLRDLLSNINSKKLWVIKKILNNYC